MDKLQNLSKDRLIVVRLDDLLVANQMLLDDAISRLKESSPRKEETFLTRGQVMQMLKVVPSTLWRWQKKGILVPIWLGGQHRYRLTDIQKILGETQ